MFQGTGINNLISHTFKDQQHIAIAFILNLLKSLALKDESVGEDSMQVGHSRVLLCYMLSSN